MTESAAGWRSGFISGSSEDQTWERRRRRRRRSKSMSVISPWGDPFSAWTLGSGVPGPVHWPPAGETCPLFYFSTQTPGRLTRRDKNILYSSASVSVLSVLEYISWKVVLIPDLCLLSVPHSVSFIFFFSFSASLISTWSNQTWRILTIGTATDLLWLGNIFQNKAFIPASWT